MPILLMNWMKVLHAATRLWPGAQMTTVVKLSNYDDAKYVAERVPGWKMYPDVAIKADGTPEVTAEEAWEMGLIL